ncbi:MAG: hypothetical protein LBI19_09985 [Oscillospiraceae bacterium]|jgi:hypothetical protein|nr:hypothetical protein [Oscillospiraceae bacterium]
MITPELIERLKQVNVSKDKDKTAERVKNAFASASRKQKHLIESLSGQKRTSIYRVFKTGSLSAKILLPLSENLNITPFWFTGESDEMEPCSDALILSFLDGRGYKFSPKQSARGRKAAAQTGAAQEEKPARAARTSPPVEEETVTVSITLSNTPKMQDAVTNLDADNAVQLLHALYLRAKAGGNAEQLWDVVKLCLLS